MVSGIFTWGVARRLTSEVTVASDLSRDVDKMYRTYVPPEHLAGFAADMGAALDAYGAAPTTMVVLRADVIAGEGLIQIKRESPELLHLTADCTKPMRLRISQLYFPLWKLTRPSQMRLTSSIDGLMEINVPGIRLQDVYIAFDVGAAERWGVKDVGIIASDRNLCRLPSSQIIFVPPLELNALARTLNERKFRLPSIVNNFPSISS